jgi:hypothetical protein
VHETCDLWGFFYKCSRIVDKNYPKVYIYILIGLEETNKAVYICGSKTNWTFGKWI